MRWTVHIEGGPRRVNHAAVCIGDKIFSFGGYCSTEEYKDWEPIPVHMLTTSTLRWSAVDYKDNAFIPFQRYGHSTVAFGHKVYMWGGRNNAVACDTLSCFNTRKLEWSTPQVSGMVPFAKDGHSACVIKNKMYIFGGFEYLNDVYSQDIHCLDLTTMIWNTVNPQGKPPSHRDFHTAVAFGDRMYIFGGRGDSNNPYNSQEEIYCRLVHYLDTVTETWVTLEPSGNWPDGRRSHSAWLYRDEMYIFGGFNEFSKRHYNDIHKYSIKNNSWEPVTPLGSVPCKRRRQACLVYEDKVYLFGGTSPSPYRSFRRKTLMNKRDKLIDNSDLHVLDYAPTLKTLAILTVIKHSIDISVLPREIIMDIRVMTIPNRISRPVNQTG